MSNSKDAIKQLRTDAWIGDAVLALYARKLLTESGMMAGSDSTKLFVEWTSNDFLRRFGEPTAVEAEIGRAFYEDGLEGGFAHMDRLILPRLIAEWANIGKKERDSKRLALVEKLKERLVVTSGN